MRGKRVIRCVVPVMGCLVIVAIVGGGAVLRRHAAIRTIELAGGVVLYDYHEYDERSVWLTSLTRGSDGVVLNAIREGSPHNWVEIPALATPILAEFDASDRESVKAVRSLHTLLRIDGFPGAGAPCGSLADYGWFREHAELRCLQVPVRPTANDDLFLRQVEKMKRLGVLTVPGAQFSDEGIECLVNHPSLQMLSIGGRGMTPRSLDVFATMPRLRMLILQPDVSIPDDAVRRFASRHSRIAVWQNGLLVRGADEMAPSAEAD